MMQIGLEWHTGNVDLMQVEGEGVLVYRSDPHMFLFSTKGEFGIEAGDRFMAHTFEHFRYRYGLVEKLSLEALLQHELDEFRRLETRALVGAGLRYLLAKWDDETIFVGSTYLAEYELLDDQSLVDPNDSYIHHRLSNYISMTFNLTTILRLEQSFYYQARFDDWSDYRVHSDTGLVAKISSFASIVNHFTVKYDSNTPHQVENLDTSLETSLALDF